MIDFTTIETLILEKIAHCDENFERVFHGRGHMYEGYEFLTIDSIDKVLSVAYFKEVEDTLHVRLMALFETIYKSGKYQAISLQYRYQHKAPRETIFGALPEKMYAHENGMAFELNMSDNQNNGYFGDMKIGRSFIREHAKDKNVLNLFSYTCAFSIAALKGGAASVVNVDMSKKSLETGKANHHLNKLDMRGNRFMPYNILKSWARIKKAGPYDIIIIDPPSFQKGSFASTTDYQKIIKRLDELSSEKCIVLAALNNPQLDSQFIKDIFAEYAPKFIFKERLANVESYPTKEEERALKNLVFTN